MSIYDDAILKLQTHVLALSDVTVKSAPNHPTEGLPQLPASFVYIGNGTATAESADTVRIMPTLIVDVHFSPNIFKHAFGNVNALIPELCKRLAGDPTLGATVDTIIFPINYSVFPYEWNQTFTIVARFEIPVKFRKEPIT